MAELPTDVFLSTAVELNRRLIQKEFSAVQLAKAFAERMETLGPRFGALSLQDAAHHKARDVDRELKRDRTRGPLQGVPYAVDDLLSVSGRPSTWGTKLFAGQVFDYNAAVVDRLGKSGAVLAAKLSARELGGAGRLAPPATSPAASAVAAGLVPYALSVECAGSMMIPAAAHHVTLLKPTYGLVSRFGAMPLAWTLDRIAITARSAEDCGHVLHAVAGGDERDAGSSGKSFHFALQYEKPVAAMRIGFAPSDFVAPPVAALRAVLDLLKQAGATLVEAHLPEFPYQSAARTILAAESACTFADLVSSGAVEQMADRQQKDGLRAGLEIPAVQYLTAMRVRRLVQHAMGGLLAPLDLLIVPTDPAAPAGKPDEGRSSTARPHWGFSDHLPAVDLAGLPALVIPGPGADGTAGSICLIAKAQCENALLQVGEYLQTRSDWHKQTPAA
ncbi:amidase [uncultured Paludibaculum sp.]|uniref:amidase n=1 Tax=uncultured Paludibaculum sp. TaxID=1765020 RepID=UPI002AAA7F15|nr:amidase [uncultured Paludibaculum sp.]